MPLVTGWSRLPAILYPPPGEEGMMSWVFGHYQDHLEIVQALNKQFGIELKTYIIHPLPQSDMRLWLQRHQFFHNDMNSLLGIQGSDLQGLDLKDPENVEEWMAVQFKEHQAARVLLKI